MKKLTRTLSFICIFAVLSILFIYPDYAESQAMENPSSSIALDDDQNSFLGGVINNSFNIFTDPKCTSDIAKKIIAAINIKRQPIYPIKWISTKNSEISLTFDDGNDSKSIVRVLDAAKKYGVKCTFFVIGKCLTYYPDLWKRAVEEGHHVCNHTQTHPMLSSLSDQEVKNQITGWETTAKKILGEDYVSGMKLQYPYFRLPGGDGDSQKRIMKIVADLGYIPVGWSLETVSSILNHHDLKNEAAGPIAESVSRYVSSNSTKGMIVLMHFNAYDSLYIDSTIKKILDRGLKIKDISEFIK